MPDHVQPGDNLMLYRDERSAYLVVYKPGGRFECHHGLLIFPEQLPWGATLMTNREIPMIVLRPTHSELMTLLKRRTTVVYPKEAGRILMELGVRAGARIGECGSGSGVMSSLMAQMVGPEGRIYSRERVPEHLEQAERNAARMGVSQRIEFQLRDVGREGFGVEDLDGVFIDVPEPWQLAGAARAALTGGAPWVSLSPTVDQITRTERTLFDQGFVRRRMLELSERGWKLFPGRMRPMDRMVGHTAFLLVARKALEPEYWRKEKPVDAR